MSMPKGEYEKLIQEARELFDVEHQLSDELNDVIELCLAEGQRRYAERIEKVIAVMEKEDVAVNSGELELWWKGYAKGYEKALSELKSRISQSGKE